jgi:hypothetical protein
MHRRDIFFLIKTSKSDMPRHIKLHYAVINYVNLKDPKNSMKI